VVWWIVGCALLGLVVGARLGAGDAYRRGEWMDVWLTVPLGAVAGGVVGAIAGAVLGTAFA
jgi:hypothetical protein